MFVSALGLENGKQSSQGIKFKEALPVRIHRHLTRFTLVLALIVGEVVLKHMLKFVLFPNISIMLNTFKFLEQALE